MENYNSNGYTSFQCISNNHRHIYRWCNSLQHCNFGKWVLVHWSLGHARSEIYQSPWRVEYKSESYHHKKPSGYIGVGSNTKKHFSNHVDSLLCYLLENDHFKPWVYVCMYILWCHRVKYPWSIFLEIMLPLLCYIENDHFFKAFTSNFGIGFKY